MIRLIKRMKNQKVWKGNCSGCESIVVIEREDWNRKFGHKSDSARCPVCGDYIYLNQCDYLYERELLG